MQEERASKRSSAGEQWTSLNTHQKIAFITLVVGAVFVFVFSALRVREAVYAPFMVPIDEIEEAKELLKDPITEAEALKKRIDTDGDGLSDWAEENVYQTSPYLWSTAGDSVPDNVKIARGENPLCKSGEPCESLRLQYNLPTTTLPLQTINQTGADSVFDEALFGDNAAAQNFQDAASEAGVNLSIENAVPRDPAVLRKALLDSGQVTQEDLDAYTDEQLLQFLDEAIAEVESQQSVQSNSKADNVETLPE